MVLKLLSLLLRYPDDEILAAREEIADEARELEDSPARESILNFLAYWTGAPQRRLRSEYVETFDFKARNALYLTYFRYGDQRARGQVLAGFKDLYARVGYELDTGELPDYLPLALEFASEEPEEGLALIAGYRGGLEVVRKSLTQGQSPYAHLIDALVSLLPEMEDTDAEEARGIAANGPPREMVGLEPYGPESPPQAPEQAPAPQPNVTFHGRKR